MLFVNPSQLHFSLIKVKKVSVYICTVPFPSSLKNYPEWSLKYNLRYIKMLGEGGAKGIRESDAPTFLRIHISCAIKI